MHAVALRLTLRVAIETERAFRDDVLDHGQVGLTLRNVGRLSFHGQRHEAVAILASLAKGNERVVQDRLESRVEKLRGAHLGTLRGLCVSLRVRDLVHALTHVSVVSGLTASVLVANCIGELTDKTEGT